MGDPEGWARVVCGAADVGQQGWVEELVGKGSLGFWCVWTAPPLAISHHAPIMPHHAPSAPLPACLCPRR